MDMPWVTTTSWILPIRSARGGAISKPTPIASEPQANMVPTAESVRR